MKAFFFLTMALLGMSSTALAVEPTCEKISGQVSELKANLIEQASNPIVPTVVLVGTRDALTNAMDELNRVNRPEESCPVAHLSGEIAQILQAISDLEHRAAMQTAEIPR